MARVARADAANDSRRAVFIAEPPPVYRVLPAVVVDASLVCAALFEEPEGPEALRLMNDRRLCAPRLIDQEVVNVVLVKTHRGLAPDAARRILADYLEQPIELSDPDLEAQFALATRYGLSGYDAAYLWLAAELRVPLLTFDRKLGEAARTHLASLG